MEVFCSCQEFFLEHITILAGNRISLQNTSKPGSLEIRKISQKFHKFSCRTHHYLLNRLKFINYMKYSSAEHLPKNARSEIPWEHMFLVYAARWLLFPCIFVWHLPKVASSEILWEHMFLVYAARWLLFLCIFVCTFYYNHTWWNGPGILFYA